ncbi:MAG: hypothetical protein PHW02_04650 [bacterium]|nr:hypothetical protein [bacterium]
MKNKVFMMLLAGFAFLLTASAQDKSMPDKASSYETHPFFMNIYDSSNPFFSENILQGKMLFASQNRIFSGSMFSFMARTEFYDPAAEIGFAEFIVPNKTSYDISIIRDPFTTRLYASLGKEDSVSSISSLSRLYLEGQTLLEHETDFYGDYNGYAVSANIRQNRFSFLAGLKKESFSAQAGAASGNMLLGRGFFLKSNFYLFTDFNFNYKTKSIDGIFYSKYHYSNGRLHITPQAVYDSILFLQAGILYRILPEISGYANYSRKNNLNAASAGIKVNAGGLKADILPISYEGRTAGARTSVLYERGWLSLNANAEYFDSIAFDLNGAAGADFFNGNLVLKLITGYSSRAVASIFLVAKVIDANLFFGGDFAVETKEYMLKGGFTWLFKD